MRTSSATATWTGSLAEAATGECPVSRALAGNLEIHLDAELIG